MQTRTNHDTSFFLALATALAAIACGGSSSSGKDTSNSGTTTGGAGGSAASSVTSGGGTNSSPNTSNSAAANSSNAASGGTGGSGESGGTTSTASGAGGVDTTSAGGLGGTSGSGGATGGSASGGASSSGGSSGGGGTAGSGGTGPTGVIGVLGEPCDSPGQLACAGNHQKLTVVCGGDGEWEVNETCGATEFCDSAEGVATGLCVEPTEACVNRVPGELFCEQPSVVACDVDGLRTRVVEECMTPCSEGACEEFGAPCPTEEFVNCSRQCGEFECLASEDDCVRGQPLDDYLEAVGDSVIVRTASYSDLCVRAGERCGDEIRAMPVGASNLRLRCTVDAPWGIVTEARLSEDACAERRPCEIVEAGDISSTVAWVEISDPEAGPINVLVEVVDEEATCP